MDKTKLKKLFHELKATTSDVIFTLFMFSMLYLLIHALITDYREGDRIKGSSITVTSKGHEYIIFETARGYTCCIHSAAFFLPSQEVITHLSPPSPAILSLVSRERIKRR